jgi:ferredoxin
MALFIDLEIDKGKCLGLQKCGKCVAVCPVKIFTPEANLPGTDDENLDECTLCGLCLQKCEPDALKVLKLYE